MYILVNIDGSGGNYSHDMTYVGGSITSGATYKYVTKLSSTPNPHQYYFWCSDGHGGIDQTSVQDGPIIEPTIVILKDLVKNPDNPIEMINFEDILDMG